MKQLIFTIVAVFGSLCAIAQTENPNYDKALAEKLGGDQYGMKNYVLAILKTGPAKVEDQEERNRLFRGHMENINRLSDEGKLVVAGPFGKNEKNYRGLFILNATTVEEAKTLVETDPAVKAGLFEVELLPWYGSAALGEYINAHEKIEKIKP